MLSNKLRHNQTPLKTFTSLCYAMPVGNEGSHSFTRHPYVYPKVELTIPAFTPQPQSITKLWLVLIFHLAQVK